MAGTDDNAPHRLSPIPEHTPPDIDTLYTRVRADLSATPAKRFWNRRKLSRLDKAYNQCLRSQQALNESAAKVPKPEAWELMAAHASHREAIASLSRKVAKLSNRSDSARQLQSHLDEEARSLNEESDVVTRAVRPMSDAEVTAAIGTDISLTMQPFASRRPAGVAPPPGHAQTGNQSAQTPAANAHPSAPAAAGQSASESRPRRRKLTKNPPARKPVPTQQGPDRKGPSLLHRLSQRWTR